ncbi:hypothetical protein C1N61_29795 (plasmid) [Priestia aryabhattai]
MGGKEGSRGYLYQAIASVLNSLNEDDWNSVQIEPDSTNDKIDILWEYENNRKRATQVKSSINNITKGDILKWLEDLIEDAGEVEEVSLLLIGSCNDITKRFINQLDKRSSSNFQLEIEGKLKLPDNINSFSGAVHIQLENFNQEALESKINIALDKFLTKRGHSVNYYTREMMVGAIIYQFFGLSKDGRKMSREEFEHQILDWVYFNYPEVKGTDLLKKNLAVYFYFSQRFSFSTKIEGFPFGFRSNPFIEAEKEDLLQAIKEIESIDLPSKKFESYVQEEKKANSWNNALIGIITPPIYKYLEISSEDKNNLIRRTQELLGKTIQKNFFYVGELKEDISSRTKSILPVNYPRVEGTELETKKNGLIRNFIRGLNRLEETIRYFNYLRTFAVIPLVLKNEGTEFNEEINVTLRFPKNVKVATSKTFKSPNNIELIEQFIDSNGIFDQVLRHREDSRVAENTNLYHSLRMPSLPAFPFENQAKNLDDTKKDFRKYVRSLFSADVFEDQEETVLKYNFSKLNVSESISFPSFILVESDTSFEINYEITSKNLTRLIKGMLFYEK